MSYRYDVALSFAGENRPYVEQVAEDLRSRGVRVFYDLYEQATLWGKNLYNHLRDVYQHQARFTVIFISREYASKLWTSHERESAQARAFEENQEYILPARFDDADVPGILRTIAYVDLRETSPQHLCELIVQKLQHFRGDLEAPRHMLLKGGTPTGDLRFSYASICPGDASYGGGASTGDVWSVDSFLVCPAQYRSFDEVLDDIFMHYLANRVRPYSYGLDWLIVGEPFRTRLLAPPQWACATHRPIHELSASWLRSVPKDLGIVPGSNWSLEFLTEGAVDRFKNAYVFASSNDEIAHLMLTEAKAVSLLKTHGILKDCSADELRFDEFRYVFVFRDWLSVCGRTGDFKKGPKATCPALVDTGNHNLPRRSGKSLGNVLGSTINISMVVRSDLERKYPRGPDNPLATCQRR